MEINTARNWFNNPANSTRLRELLKDPIFSAACELLLFESQPNNMLSLTPEILANKYCFLAGYNQFVRDIKQLCEAPVDSPSFMGEEWNYNTNE